MNIRHNILLYFVFVVTLILSLGINAQTSDKIYVYYNDGEVIEYPLENFDSISPIVPLARLSVSDSSVVFSPNGGTKTISVKSNTTWHAVVQDTASWVRYGDERDYNKNFYITVKEAPSIEDVQTSFQIVTDWREPKTKTINVKRRGRDFKIVSPDRISSSGGLQQIMIDIRSKINWKAVTPNPSVELIPNTGSPGTPSVLLNLKRLYWNYDTQILFKDDNDSIVAVLHCDLDHSVPEYTEPVVDVCGIKYPTVKIGDQVWMAAGLRCNRYSYNSDVDESLKGKKIMFPAKGHDTSLGTSAPCCDSLSWEQCADIDPYRRDYLKYGYRYNYAAVVGVPNGDADSVVYGWVRRQGVCPDGWHVPSKYEYSQLAKFADMEAEGHLNRSGDSLKSNQLLRSASGWSHYPDKLRDGLDTYGFSAYGVTSYSKFGLEGNHATSTMTSDKRWVTKYFSYKDIVPEEFEYQGRGLGVVLRCIKDYPLVNVDFLGGSNFITIPTHASGMDDAELIFKCPINWKLTGIDYFDVNTNHGSASSNYQTVKIAAKDHIPHEEGAFFISNEEGVPVAKVYYKIDR